jgi:hypothetical protein
MKLLGIIRVSFDVKNQHHQSDILHSSDTGENTEVQ